MNHYLLSLQDILLIFKQKFDNSRKVFQIAFEYNWEPSNSRSVQNNYLKIWAAVKDDPSGGQLYLHGRPLGGLSWNINEPFTVIEHIGDYGIYVLDLYGEFPEEYVLRFEANNGSVVYDNNEGIGTNYRLTPYKGRASSALASGNAVYTFPSPIHFSLISKNK